MRWTVQIAEIASDWAPMQLSLARRAEMESTDPLGSLLVIAGCGSSGGLGASTPGPSRVYGPEGSTKSISQRLIAYRNCRYRAGSMLSRHRGDAVLLTQVIVKLPMTHCMSRRVMLKRRVSRTATLQSPGEAK
jgi:hypothetical protein